MKLIIEEQFPEPRTFYVQGMVVALYALQDKAATAKAEHDDAMRQKKHVEARAHAGKMHDYVQQTIGAINLCLCQGTASHKKLEPIVDWVRSPAFYEYIPDEAIDAHYGRRPSEAAKTTATEAEAAAKPATLTPVLAVDRELSVEAIHHRLKTAIQAKEKEAEVDF